MAADESSWVPPSFRSRAGSSFAVVNTWCGVTPSTASAWRRTRELEVALALVRKAASGEALTTDQGRGLVDIIARYQQTFLLLQRYDNWLISSEGIRMASAPSR